MNKRECKPTCASRCRGDMLWCGHTSHACDCGAEAPEPVASETPEGDGATARTRHEVAIGAIQTARERWLLQEVSSAGRLKIDASQYDELRALANRLLGMTASPKVERRHSLNRTDYEKLIAEDLTWLAEQPRSLERDHIEVIVRSSPDREYGATSPEVAKLREALVSLRSAVRELGKCQACRGSGKQGVFSMRGLGAWAHRERVGEEPCTMCDGTSLTDTARVALAETETKEMDRG